jgi:hypothetical protein
VTINDFVKAMKANFTIIGYRCTNFETGQVIDRGYPKINESGIWRDSTPAWKPREKKGK